MYDTSFVAVPVFRSRLLKMFVVIFYSDRFNFLIVDLLQELRNCYLTFLILFMFSKIFLLFMSFTAIVVLLMSFKHA